MPVTEKEFQRSSVAARLEHVRKEGTYLGGRQHGGHLVHLYRMEGFFCEVWMRVGWEAVEWVEVARNADVLTEYIHLDLRGLMGGAEQE